MMPLDNREMDNSVQQMLRSSAYRRSAMVLIGIDMAVAAGLAAIILFDAWRSRKTTVPRIGCGLFQLGAN